MDDFKPTPPLILSPAGERDSFLAAMAGGADAIYCGLEKFSARMAAKNFRLHELADLTNLAHENNVKVYIAFNSILRPEELSQAGAYIQRLERHVRPDALIVADIGLLPLVRDAGFSGEIHLSTLANVTFPAALGMLSEKFGITRVVIPRELNIDEIKQMAAACPKGLSLEVFTQGALCYAVSGRCYWSSYMGGKSGLRGRCVQPCRRIYRQGSEKAKHFSLRDLSLDVLVKVLLNIQNIRAWKIEGRKKGPHYVFYTTKAHRILRDHSSDSQAVKEAGRLLDYSLGRVGTHYFFLPHRPYNPIDHEGQTGSGLFVGRTKGSAKNMFLAPRTDLMAGDILRAGYEDESWHSVIHVKKYVPKQGKLFLKTAPGKGTSKSVPVFLVDRREKALAEMIAELGKKIKSSQSIAPSPDDFSLSLHKKELKQQESFEVAVHRELPGGPVGGSPVGFWIPEDGAGLDSFFSFAKKNINSKNINSKSINSKSGDAKSESVKNENVKTSPSKKRKKRSGPRNSGPAPTPWWWLPPVIWPGDQGNIQTAIETILKKGFTHFVLNAPWQLALFPKMKSLNLWAGPFCNLSNPLAIQTAAEFGFSGVIVSPELSGGDFLSLPSLCRIPLGIVIYGSWPLCVSRNVSERLTMETPFFSPKNEGAWVAKNGPNHWVFPNWRLDIRSKKRLLEKAGYRMTAVFYEPVPKQIKIMERPGMWNWNIGLN